MTCVIREQLSEQPSCLITSLPDDVLVDILARVPRCNYPTLSLVSMHFHSLVTSCEIYKRRTLLGCTEACIYVGIYNYDTKDSRLYILSHKNRLVLIQPLPHMSYVASYVAVGTRIYVFGEHNDLGFLPALSSCIDCRSHKVQPLPDMTVPMVGDVADLIDGKIYIIGYNNYEGTKMMVVFNTETQIWESEITKLDMELMDVAQGCVVRPNKLYLWNAHNSFVYRPKENKWETIELLSSKGFMSVCVVVDEVLYCYDCFKHKLRAYDTKHKCWQVVKGVKDFLPEGTCVWGSETVKYGGKLAVLLSIRLQHPGRRIKEIWFVEISIERRQGGEIWGKVECCDVVFKGDVYLHKPLVVTV